MWRLKQRNGKKPGSGSESACLKEPIITDVLATASAAAQEVLSTSELLSLIFAYLPPSTLVLSATRVCRTWYNILSKPVPDLQVSLFLRPAPEECYLFGALTANDLLTTAFPFWFLFRKKLPKPGVCGCRPNRCGTWSTATSITLLPWKRNPSAWQRSAPSWRRMLVAQPHLTTLEMQKVTYLRNDEGWRRGHGNRTRFAVTCPDGVTLGTLYDIIEGWIREAKDAQYVSEYMERRRRDGNDLGAFDPDWDRGQWDRKELFVCDQETRQMLLLHLDLDRYTLSRV